LIAPSHDDWRSYDTVAEAYERIAAPHFETVARRLLAAARPTPAARFLDLGTGTGAVAVALSEGRKTRWRLVGVDLSLPMLSLARRRVPWLYPVLGNAFRTPFRNGSFDLVTANFVLSHLEDYRGGLREVLRVLARPAAFAASCWGPASDPYHAVWRELLDTAIGPEAVQDAIEAVAPWERHFSSPASVRAALLEAGFGGVQVERFDLTFDQSVQEYVADRALGAAGRFARRSLGEVGWRRFIARLEAELRRRLGERIRYARAVVLAVGTVA